MASFSSHRVGLALIPYDLVTDSMLIPNFENRTLRPTTDTLLIIDIKNPDISLARKSEVMPGLNLLRETNNAVFKDIGWAHEAYVAEDGGGLTAIQDAIGGETFMTS